MKQSGKTSGKNHAKMRKIRDMRSGKSIKLNYVSFFKAWNLGRTSDFFPVDTATCQIPLRSIALHIDDVSVHVCSHLPFSFAFPTIKNGSFEIPSQSISICLSAFGSYK